MILINSAIFDGAFKASRDYIQPVMRNFIIAYPILLMIENEHNRETLLIALLYLLINIFGAFSSRWSHKLENYCTRSDTPLNYLFLGQAFLLLGTGVFIEMNLYVVFTLFLLLNISSNLRRPLLLSCLVDEIEEVQRATMLSIESQLKSLTVVILAPLLGLVADLFSIRLMFIFISLFLIVLYVIALRLDTEVNEERRS
ncbi:MAG: hypothetical protein ACOC4G_02575 [Bacillota bacterium]